MLDEISINLDSRRVPITKADRKPGDYPYYGASGIVDFVADYIFEEDTLLISEDGANLLARSSPVAFPASGKYWVNNHAHILKFQNKITQRLVELYFESIPLDDFVTGAAQPKLSQKALYSIPIPVPEFPEQQRIVGILDEAFDGIATAKANAEKNLQNARALFASHLNSVFTQRGAGWEQKRLGELSKINYGYTESASAEDVGPKFLRITDIQDNHVEWETVPYCSIAATDFPRYKLVDGDIVFARTGATTGKSYMVTNPPKAVFASYLIRLRVSAANLLPEFVNLFFQTGTYWDVIRSGVSGSAQGGFNATKLGELMIPFPKSVKVQQSIVAKLAALSAETRRLGTIYQQKLAALEELKKSLLHQAFTGQLTMDNG